MGSGVEVKEEVDVDPLCVSGASQLDREESTPVKMELEALEKSEPSWILPALSDQRNEKVEAMLFPRTILNLLRSRAHCKKVPFCLIG